MGKAPKSDLHKIDPQEQARILIEALPHMQRYDEQIVVVKYGGHAMGQEQTARDFARDIVLLEQTAINPVDPPQVVLPGYGHMLSALHRAGHGPASSSEGRIPPARYAV